jgi:F-type H+-transporting ATPase subunit b
MKTNDIVRRLTCIASVILGAVSVSGAEQTGHGATEGGIVSQLHLDPQIILAQAVGFLAMFVILWFAVFRRVGELLDRRRDDIASRLRKLEEDRLELARLKEEAHQHLINAEREALARLNATVEEATELREEILRQAHDGAEAELAHVRETIARETAAAIREIRTEVADLAVQAAARILDENLDSERNRRLVNEFIERLPSPTA